MSGTIQCHCSKCDKNFEVEWKKRARPRTVCDDCKRRYHHAYIAAHQATKRPRPPHYVSETRRLDTKLRKAFGIAVNTPEFLAKLDKLAVKLPTVYPQNSLGRRLVLAARAAKGLPLWSGED